MRALVIALVLSCLSQAAFAGRRVALVIGNASYREFGTLGNPVRDAQSIGALLKGAGFDLVETDTDVDLRTFRKALANFEIASAGSDIALIYYSGHGVEIGGKNFLVPVDAELKRDVDVQDEALSLDRVLDAIGGARRLRIVILDACRSNPFRTMQMSSATRAVGRGLAPIEPGGGTTLVAYAAAAGTVALDGRAGEHSPFTEALLKDLVVPDLDVRLALGRVHDDVLAATNNAQEPFTYGSLGGAELPLSGRSEPAALPPSPSAAPMEAKAPALPRLATPRARLSAPIVGLRAARPVASLERPRRPHPPPEPARHERALSIDTSLNGVATEEPPAHTLPSGQRMLVNDRSCPSGLIKEITGGSGTSPRTRRCIPRG